MNSQITKQTHQQESIVTPSAGGLLKRKHDFGAHANVDVGLNEHSNKKELSLQPKLKVNEPGDIYEQEADRIADQVMAMPANAKAGSPPMNIQRLTGGPARQRNTAPAIVDQALASPGRPLESSLRQDMEQRFGYDFSSVRVHTGAEADRSINELNAYAYTLGRDVVLTSGLSFYGSQLGRKVLIHELAHVIQQTGQQDSYQRQSCEDTNLAFLPSLNKYAKSGLIMRFRRSLPREWSSLVPSYIDFNLRYKFMRNGHTLLDRAFTTFNNSPQVNLPHGEYLAKIHGEVRTMQGCDVAIRDIIFGGKYRNGRWRCRLEWPVVVDNQGGVTVQDRARSSVPIEGGGGNGTWSIELFEISNRVGVQFRLSSTASTTTTIGGTIGEGVQGSMGREYGAGETHIGEYRLVVQIQGEPAPREPIIGEVEIGEVEMVETDRTLLTIQGFPEGRAEFPSTASDHMFVWFSSLPPVLKDSIRNGRTRVRFEGHASTTESESVNIDISRSRALNVRNRFCSTIFNEQNIQAAGLGEEESQCQGRECPEERRVDIVVILSRNDLGDLNELLNLSHETINLERL
ncbi:putative membrane protein [Desulfosarcina variabilis str. Montpellier]|uniref:eCIS core domain-containing protein n=1 Tax=Desulfosarcina variabilis TaxID=2300 RepID=UPI003AFA6D35